MLLEVFFLGFWLWVFHTWAFPFLEMGFWLHLVGGSFFSCSHRIRNFTYFFFLLSFNCFPIFSNGFLCMSLLMFDLLRLGKPWICLSLSLFFFFLEWLSSKDSEGVICWSRCLMYYCDSCDEFVWLNLLLRFVVCLIVWFLLYRN